MRIMVLGASGFIGRQILVELLAGGHEVVGVVRSIGALGAAFPQARFLEMDLAKATRAEDWHGRLAHIDCIVNAAGILRGRDMDAIHADMPRVVGTAAHAAGVRHMVLISAISAREDVPTDYARTKLEGERIVRAAPMGWTILRPSLVYGDGSYGGTSLMRGMAGLPVLIPLPGDGRFAFSPIHTRDLARTVATVCGNPAYFGQTLEPAGPETLSLKELLRRYRGWLGFGKARFLSIPMPLMRLMGHVGDITGSGPIATNSLVQMVAGNAGDGTAFARAIGFAPRSLDAALLARPAQVQDRWHARLFFLAPAIKAILLLLWLASAWLGFAHGVEKTAELVRALGLPEGWAGPLRIGSSVMDLVIAALLLWDRRARWSTAVQCLVVLGYSLVIGFALPQLWLDPLGPLLKNLPILLLICVHGAIGDRR
ncbi:nucleoside-diphosphate sugar epimerase [Azorhizobium oxalatiphilum]|uniref:Nucleoside-diphosphate sugar epimerase n=1 Tax=Azorhizobium oxalatiphilum TaxID=980631 RepID=A0A917C0J0_9HYPH|nr:SDR family oxidoreductase [Azorhizobium oxalatiphilum]GGF64037.1 nucleoside-diphosphate sugar epimerase [Azorhizobium oxalatiphilum]